MRSMLKIVCCVLGSLTFASVASAIDPAVDPTRLLKELEDSALSAVSIGMTSNTTPVVAVVHRDDYDVGIKKTRVLLVANSSWGSHSIGRALTWFYKSDAAAAYRERFVLSAIPHLRPGSTLPLPLGFPPQGDSYADKGAAEQKYAWRWIGMFAPDLVVHVQGGERRSDYLPNAPHSRAFKDAFPDSSTPGERDQLVDALAEHSPCDVGKIPAARMTTAGKGTDEFVKQLFERLGALDNVPTSPARIELRARLARSPIEVAEQLSRVYGHELNSVVYIPTLALIGRLRLGDLTNEKKHADDVAAIVKPYVAGDKETKPTNGSGLSGHLIFAELAERTSDTRLRRRYLSLAKNAADLGFGKGSELKPSMPHHSEMSDSLFMGGPILAHVGSLTDDDRYFEMCLRHLRFMRELCLRDDGLYRHSPLDEAAWGRGNGFPALGLALCLSHWPEKRDDRAELLEMYRTHMKTLVQHQDASGCWHQVVDRLQSYREFSCTCMITFAMVRGVREGWLEKATYDPVVRRAWSAIQLRIAADGQLVDVCTGTGKQKTSQAYYDRKAILGKDARGGAMALLVSTEMASYLGK